jgi:hypothetical protein
MNEPNIYYIYNEYVLGDVDYYEDIYDNSDVIEEIAEYDDSSEWYNVEYDGE